MNQEFSPVLRKFREQAGYDSARSFFQALGGRGFFGCTYKQYLNVEGGRSVPQPRLVERLAAGLRIAVDEGRSRDFVLAYLRSLMGREQLYNFVVGALSGKNSVPGGAKSPLRQALRRSFSERTFPLTQAQSTLLCKSGENYWCFTVLSDDRGHWSVHELSRLLGYPEPKVKSALGRLVEAEVAAKDREGKYFCPLAGRVFLHPRDELHAPSVAKALKAHWDLMAQKRGSHILYQHLFTRASESELRNYFPYLAQSVQGADIYSTDEKGPDTSLFLIEATVRKVLPF